MARRQQTVPGLCLLLLLLSSPVHAQPLGTFGELPLAVNVGDRLAVEEASGRRITGRLLRVSPDALTLETPAGQQRTTREDVRTVALRGHALGRGAVIGAAALGTLGVVATCTHEGGADCAFIGLAAAPIGIGVGAAIGALVPRMRTVYRRPTAGLAEPGTGQGTSAEAGLLDSLGLHVNLGDRLRVRDASGHVASGRLTTLTADDLVIRTSTGAHRVSRDALRTVDVQRRPLRPAVLVGAGIGVVVGAVAACTGTEREECVDGPILAGGFGAGLGLVAGAIWRRTTPVYPAARARVALVPSVSRHRATLMVSRTW